MFSSFYFHYRMICIIEIYSSLSPKQKYSTNILFPCLINTFIYFLKSSFLYPLPLSYNIFYSPGTILDAGTNSEQDGQGPRSPATCHPWGSQKSKTVRPWRGLWRGPRFCHLEAAFWDTDFKLLRNKRFQKNPWPSSSLPKRFSWKNLLWEGNLRTLASAA